MADRKQTDEEQFAESFKEVLAVIEKLSPFCKSPDDMIDMLRLALKSDGQLRLLIAVLSAER